MNRLERDRWISIAAFREALAEADSRLAAIRERYRPLGECAALERGGCQTDVAADLPRSLR